MSNILARLRRRLDVKIETKRRPGPLRGLVRLAVSQRLGIDGLGHNQKSNFWSKFWIQKINLEYR